MKQRRGRLIKHKNKGTAPRVLPVCGRRLADQTDPTIRNVSRGAYGVESFLTNRTATVTISSFYSSGILRVPFSVREVWYSIYAGQLRASRQKKFSAPPYYKRKRVFRPENPRKKLFQKDLTKTGKPCYNDATIKSARGTAPTTARQPTARQGANG